jgi:FkbM family methyltransferase
MKALIKSLAPRWFIAMHFRSKSRSFFQSCKLVGGVFRLTDLNGRIWYTHRYRLDFYRRGYESRGLQLGTTYLLDEIEFVDGDVIVDCGANMGDLQLYFLAKGISVCYFGFEPNQSDYYCANRNLKFDGRIFMEALWSRNESITFYKDTRFASSSLIKPKKYRGAETVTARRLDSTIEILELGAIKLLKLEGEGAEPEIAFGSAGVLDRIQFISADVGPERGALELSTEKEVTEFLIQNGFEVVKRNPFHRNTVLYRNIRFS